MTETISLIQQFTKTRKRTEEICQPLETEDYVVQPIAHVSPPKWHLAHTSWFFEEFLLKPHKKDYQVFHEDFAFLFNSYYESVGKRVIRANRGNLSRPSVEKIYAYRRHITQQMDEMLNRGASKNLEEIVAIGINHEQQHQELLVTDIKYILGNNPLFPPYDTSFSEHIPDEKSPDWITLPEGLYEIGLSLNDKGFRYDNEMAKHKVWLDEFFIANKLVTNEEYLEFMESGGYNDVLLWHKEARDWIGANKVKSPAYWHFADGEWFHYTLAGLQKLELKAPVTHLSYYEAFAFAQWKEMRLPTEKEWEVAQSKFKWGSRWEWTESAYSPYPGYQKPQGAIGEYNGKFMVNQKVMRGASIATAPDHSRPTYRNFFHPHLRWQFTGLRLAK